MLPNNPEIVVPLLKHQDEKTINDAANYLEGLILRTRRPTFFSTRIPNVPNAKWLVFIFYKKEIGFIMRYKDNASYYKSLEKEDFKDIFTPNVLDLNLLTPISKEDAISRAIL